MKSKSSGSYLARACVYVCPRVVVRDAKGIGKASEGALCHFKYLHVSGLSSSFPEACLEKHLLRFLVVFVDFPQPRRSSGRNLSLSVYIVFVSNPIICNLPSPHKSHQGANAA